MKIDNSVLRKRLNAKLIKLVKPDSMSVDEYKIACNLEGFDASVENGPFLHWLITANGDPDITDKVHGAIVKAIEAKYLLDDSTAEQQSYICDAIHDICIVDKDWTIRLLEAILKNYKGTEVFNYCKRLNRVLGLTSVEYFNVDDLHSAVLRALHNEHSNKTTDENQDH